MRVSGTAVRSGGITTTDRQFGPIPLLGSCVCSVQPGIVPQALTQYVGFRYTSFTGCAILLFSASQKLLEQFREDVGQDLSYASSHLNLLSWCSHDNVIARELYTSLQIIFNDIREVLVSPVYRTMCDMHIVVKDMALVPLSHYNAVEGAQAVSETIVDITGRAMGVLTEKLSF